MKSIITVILSMLLLAACNKEKVCNEAEQKATGNVLSITGPDTLEIGKSVPLVVEVEVNDSFCVKKAEGFIINNIGNHVQIGARLIHTGYRPDNECGCTSEEKVYTVIYFTPNVAGSYIFSSKPPSPIVSFGDSTDYHIIVL